MMRPRISASLPVLMAWLACGDPPAGSASASGSSGAAVDETTTAAPTSTGDAAEPTLAGSAGTSSMPETETAGETGETATGTAETATGTTAEPCPPGADGCACKPGGLCEAPLVCVDEVCAPVSPTCGDGVVDAGETCDDGANGDNDDGCTDLCVPPACGDGFVQPNAGEGCDDGPDNSDEGACTTACAPAACGDGLVHAGVEACDDGGANGPGQACLAGCVVNVCGDGDAGPGEACDDGNAADDDACLATCAAASCGDGFVHAGVEQCDDGNAVDGDGCTAACAASGVLAVEATTSNTCALLAGGAVRCWGGGVPSQNGIPGYEPGIGDDELPNSVPTIDIGGTAVDIAAGSNHTCALLTGGAVRCWGWGQLGRTGLATTEHVGDDEHPSTFPPLALDGIALEISAYGAHSCATLVGGLVRCWGSNASGRLGLGHTDNVGDDEHPDSQPPVMLGGSAVATSAGQSHTCALLSTKQIRCWGAGLFGQLGQGNNQDIGAINHPAAFPPVGFTEVEKVSAGGTHTCLLRAGGAVHCFGRNQDGQLGLGHIADIGNNEDPDVGPVELGAPAIDVDAGGEFSCAVLQGGAIRCWGKNNRGQLGLANTTSVGDDELPTAAPTIQLGGPAVRVTAGLEHACALMASGSVRCWGYGASGRLGYGNTQIVGDDEHPESAGDVQLF